MYRRIAVVIAAAATGALALASSVTFAGPATAASLDVTAALNELTAAAATTHTAAAGGFTAGGDYLASGGVTFETVVDGAGLGRQIIHTTPEDQISYASTGVGLWTYRPARFLQKYAAGLAWIGKPGAEYVFEPSTRTTTDNVGMTSGADQVDHLERTHFTFLTADRVDDGSGHLTYTLTGYVDVPRQPTTLTVTLTGGLVTRFVHHTPVVDPADSEPLHLDQHWTYEPRPALTLPPAAVTTTWLELFTSRSAVALRATVKAHGKETGRLAKTWPARPDGRRSG